MVRGENAFTTCAQCGNWAWNWRLKRQKGACAICGTVQPGWTTTANGTWYAPWYEGQADWYI